MTPARKGKKVKFYRKNWSIVEWRNTFKFEKRIYTCGGVERGLEFQGLTRGMARKKGNFKRGDDYFRRR